MSTDGDGNGHTNAATRALRPSSNLVTPLLTDMYQITMTYGYWKQRRHEDPSIFEMHFRKTPFKGEFAIFAGIDEILNHLANFKFTDDDVDYLRTQLPHADEEFFAWVRGLDCSAVRVYSLRNGTVCFAREPLIRVEGPLAVAQLLETTLLNLVNYPSLIATNAARFRLAAGADKVLFEFGLRRAQGPDGGMTASKYSYLGGFDGTSNVQAGKMFGIKISGTHAHAFVQAYASLDELPSPMLGGLNIVERSLEYREKLGFSESNLGEMAAFIAYAQAWPSNFLCLVDTYDTLRSGVANFIAVGLALHDAGYDPVGIRLDSGDLAYLSRKIRRWFDEVAARQGRECFKKVRIVASNDINEEVLHSLAKQGHCIDVFGVGTHLVTCQAQPALGCVYKLVQISGRPRIKLSNEVSKVSIPCRKNLYRLFSDNHEALVDLMMRDDEPAPQPGDRLLCRHPFEAQKRAYVAPAFVESLLHLVWDGKAGGVAPKALYPLEESRTYALTQLSRIREDTLRYLNPTPFKVSVSEPLYQFFHQLWEAEAPIGVL